MGDRGQAFTLEGLLAAIIVVAGLVFALQAVVITPSTGGGSAPPADTDLLDSVLTKTAENGELKRAVLAWDGSGFHGVASGEDYYVDAFPDNEFGEIVEHALGPSVSVNVYVQYETTSDTVERVRMIYNGAPADGAVRSSTTVAILDSDPLYTSSGDPRPGTSVSSDGLYPDIDDRPGDLFTVVKVEVIAWEA